MRDQFFPSDDDRYLIIDDTDEDATELLTIICDRGYRPSLIATDMTGGAS